MKMLTGDALPVATEVAEQVGLGRNIGTVAALRSGPGAGEASYR